MKYLEELGKGLINFANIGTVLIFLKLYVNGFNYNYLLAGIIFFISFYAMGVKIIKKSEEYDDGE
jgi:polyferredoxin